MNLESKDNAKPSGKKTVLEPQAVATKTAYTIERVTNQKFENWIVDQILPKA